MEQNIEIQSKHFFLFTRSFTTMEFIVFCIVGTHSNVSKRTDQTLIAQKSNKNTSE